MFPEARNTLNLRIATRGTIYRSLWALWARNPQKISKRVLWGSAKNLGVKIPWPFFSPKTPALTSINRRKSAINPEIASINVY